MRPGATEREREKVNCEDARATMREEGKTRVTTCRYEDTRNRFRCPESVSGASPWCFWHNPDQPKSRDAVEAAVVEKRNLTGAWIEGIDLSGVDLTNVCLYGSVLRFAKLDGARLGRADLRYADLTRASLAEADLSDALLEGALLPKAVLRKAMLRYANAAGANLREADLTEADALSAHLAGADFSGCALALASLGLASLAKANLRGSVLDRADLAGANLAGTDLRGASLRGVRVDRATRFDAVRYDRRTVFSGIDTSAIDPGQNPVLLRDIRDAQFLAEYAKEHPRIFRLWKATSDCGRSLRRWSVLSLAAGALFGTARALLPGAIDGRSSTAGAYLDSLTRILSLGGSGGDALTNTGRALLLAESAASYLLFAGFLSILFHKIARRG